MPQGKLAIVGLGPISAKFIARLCLAIKASPKERNVVAIGVYDDSHAGDRARRAIARLGRWLDISVKPGRNQQSLKQDLFQLMQRVEDRQPSALLWIVDASADIRLIEACRDLFPRLKVALQIEIIALCFTDDSPAAVKAFDVIGQLAHDNAAAHGPLVEMTIVVKTNSTLFRATSDLKQDELLAKSLAGMLFAPLYSVDNIELRTQLRGLRNYGAQFVGLAITSRGVRTLPPGFAWFLRRVPWFILRRTPWFITPEEVATCVNGAVDSLLLNLPDAMTTVKPLDLQALVARPGLVNVISPISTRGDKFAPTYQGIHRQIIDPTPPPTIQGSPDPIKDAERQQDQYKKARRLLELKSLIMGRAVDLTRTDNFKKFKGDFYCQVCLLYGIQQSDIFTTGA